MKKITLILIILFFAIYSFAQFRYAETVFNEVDTIKEVEYARASWLNNPIDLLSEYNIHDGEKKTEERPLHMDIFMPHGDTLTKRPAIIFAHSGAFLLGSRLIDDMIAFCDSFARRGYVTATIDYRLGMGATVVKFLGIPINIQVKEENVSRAVYRGIQDGKAAIRFLKHNASAYGIDTTKIYMVGSSAGGFVSLHNVYYNDSTEIPTEIYQEPSLGGIDSVGIGGYNSTADAIVSMWAAVQKTEIIKDEQTPVFLIHGEEDDIVPFKNGIPLKNAVPPNPIVGLSMPETFGSFCIDTALTNRGILHQTYFVADKKHEFYGCDTGKFPDEGPNQYWDTIQWKITDFLFEQFRPVADFETEINGWAVNFINTSSEIFKAEWEFGDGNVSSEINLNYIYEFEGSYTVQLKNYNENMACDTITKTVIVPDPTGIIPILETNVQIFPNPVKNFMNITGISKPFMLAIFDIIGTKVFQQFVYESGIDVSTLNKGVYIIVIEKDNKRFMSKITKIN